jgi:hypothetical protein
MSRLKWLIASLGFLTLCLGLLCASQAQASKLPQVSATPPAATTAISVCSQHAPKCPLDPDNWVGEPDGWQFTGKKWTWYPYTLNRFNRQTIWEYSR